MEIIDRRKTLVQTGEVIFPDFIDQNPSVLYHSTSNVFEKDIEDGGLRWSKNIYTRADVKSVVEIFRKMDWVKDPSTELSAFTLKDDFRDKEQKPIYFSLFAENILQYARPSNCLGETASLLCAAFEHLDQFLTSPETRSEYRKYRWEHVCSFISGKAIKPDPSVTCDQASAADCQILVDEFNKKEPVNWQITPEIFHETPPPYVAWDEDLKWLSDKLKSFESLRSRLAEYGSRHKYGVVYAVDFTGADHLEFQDLGNKGISIDGYIEPNRIVGKAFISPEQERPSDRLDFDLRDEKLEVFKKNFKA